MEIDFQGFGTFEIRKEKYDQFVKMLKLDMDLFLHIVSKSDFCVPVLCLNFEEIESEGPKKYGHIETIIGRSRINDLINNNIVFPK